LTSPKTTGDSLETAMHIEIQSRGFEMTDALHLHVERRIRFALAHRGDVVSRVTVRLSDVNGSRGGVDKRCVVRVRVAHLPEVLVEHVHADMYAAVDHAAARAGRTVARTLDRRSTRRPAFDADFMLPDQGRPESREQAAL
jgi:putative sigma-54 modulation protein